MFQLRSLPFTQESIVEFISEKTLEYHYGKHHQTYINNLNNLIKDNEFENMHLLDIILKSSGGVFNNAAQIFNHDFYWDSIAPKGSVMSSDLKSAIEAGFGSVEKFQEELISKATTLFGSGWCWLVLTNDKLEIIQTSNAQVPMTEGKIPLLTIDVWEHAYYIDYKNARPNYLGKFWEFINWDFASKMYEEAKTNGMNAIKNYISNLYA
ncbi:superoxide dismutase [Helicobacter cholecystus]|uniref:Superoxide dismutase n=1 Tax=Helicobacter cholecystus TaxID=45498 RepID=A0A3D8IYN5_9HELI|nr:superoxide dismutase [Helicobacter cholecystus]RDU69671.1 superoxide dismutase [Helicobacter cholecystus]VEJ24235.1 superoxide dismutase [Helicobacter cholecystus]